MSKDNRDYLEMSFRSIRLFADDGQFCHANLKEVVDIALRDGVVDANEKRVLQNIIGRLSSAEMTGDMLRKLDELKRMIG